jgi:hypothetical protein
MDSPRSRGLDGKSYPPMPPPSRWRYQVIMITHQLCHELGYSQRAAQAELAAHDIRRSTGTIHNDLTRAMPGCPGCRTAPPPA